MSSGREQLVHLVRPPAWAAISKFKLTSECKCNKQYIITGFASFITFGAGAKAPVAELLSDAAGSVGSGDFIDPWNECPNPDSANGPAWVSGINVVPGVGGTFLGLLHLGHLRPDNKLVEGNVVGFDISIQAGLGASAVYSVQTVGCCSK